MPAVGLLTLADILHREIFSASAEVSGRGEKNFREFMEVYENLPRTPKDKINILTIINQLVIEYY